MSDLIYSPRHLDVMLALLIVVVATFVIAAAVYRITRRR